MNKIPLHIKIILSLFLGIIWSFVSSYLGWNDFTQNWIAPFGTIFIRILKFIAVPLVLFSIITGISNISNILQLGKIGAKTFSLYLLTTICSISIGLFLATIINPGSYLDKEKRISNRIQYELWANANSIPIADGKNVLSEQDKILLEEQLSKDDKDDKIQNLDDEIKLSQDISNRSPLAFLVDIIPPNLIQSFGDNNKMLQVIFFSIFFGVIAASINKEKRAPVVKLFNSLNEVFIKMVIVLMKASPFFVFCLLAGVVSKMASSPEEVIDIFRGLGMYSITVLIGLFLMIFVFYPLIVVLFVKRFSYKEFFENASPAQFLAFSTSSSVATLPVTMKCIEENFKVSNKISSFVLPIGATVNMDGTSLYQAVAILFGSRQLKVNLYACKPLCYL
ncbi:dicarboxylate/amino acid:cation symporter [Ichthyobacterium seriolicida]|uniref:Proton/glutamate symporter n=1 Tax=Ichthyobacterium seriolicida TaxID=242600 RepID=A0A1J1DXD5_9FLAO|nr:dicarboxylate/amino acid:cation symporter [Ichthyobacterium seriolicida]BAV94489.1 proton/glutamate symporter [Ichthyobacterium seriolicida]